MCEDCGCEQGNARAYFDQHGHSHGHEHHVHLAAPGTASSAAEIHIHLHIDAPAPHSHPHTHGDHTHDHAHIHDHAHDHTHAHPHEHAHEQAPKKTTTIPLETKILARNDDAAEENRRLLTTRGIVAVNFISSPGTGKTFLLEKTLEALQGRVPCGVIAGDQKTDNDAQRLAGKGAPVVQIETESACHLNAEQVGQHLHHVIVDNTRLVFIENVGNLVCPAAFDLGEQVKVALVSITEGEDKPLKYPVLFHEAPVTVITKIDLLPHLDVDMDRLRQSIRRVRPNSRIFEVSAKTGAGMDAWVAYLTQLAQG